MADMTDLSLDDIIKLNKKNAIKGKQNKPLQTHRLRALRERSGIARKSGPKQTGARQQTFKKEPSILHIANLHYDVSNKDLHELFSEMGTVKKAAVHYDKSGRSIGTAEVILTTREQALNALKKYNGVPLDGRAMNITLLPSQTNTRSPTKSRIGIKPNSGIKKQINKGVPKGRLATTRGRNVQQRGQRQPKKKPTAEELDADLESYQAENHF